jgi:hypothetical protein
MSPLSKILNIRQYVDGLAIFLFPVMIFSGRPFWFDVSRRPEQSFNLTGSSLSSTRDENNETYDIFNELTEQRKKHPETFTCAYLNINSIRYKFCSIKQLLTTNTVDMLIIAETKIDNSFPDAQFKIDNYHFCRADRNAHGGGLIVYVRSDLACDRKNKLECKTIESIMILYSVNVILPIKAHLLLLIVIMRILNQNSISRKNCREY